MFTRFKNLLNSKKRRSLSRIDNFILLVIGALFFAALFSLVYLPSFVIATGAAFQFTKHGAATAGENRTANGGVDRSVTGQWPPAAEAGTYLKGECSHCHEPHASFGGSEPYPNSGSYPSFMTSAEAAGPSTYLLFSNANVTGGVGSGSGVSFCWTCHENLTLQANPLGWGYYGFYQGRSMFGAHQTFGGIGIAWPGEPPSGGASTIHPRSPRTQGAICLHCHTPHGIKAANASGAYDTWAVPAANQIACTAPNTPAGCKPSLTADYLIPHQLLAWEEALCFNCHDGNPAINIKSEIEKRSLAGGSGHPVNDTTLAGRHFVGESLPITTKHVECHDCHNPHADWTSGCGGGIVTGKLSGMRYIGINGTVYDPCPKGITSPEGASGRQPYIHDVCFKCHGNSYNQVFSGNAYPDNTLIRAKSDGVTADSRSNKRLEFDPNGTDATYGPNQAFNSAYHPVAAAGRNTSLAMCLQLSGTAALPGPFDYNSSRTLLCDASYKFWMGNVTINCTDCHNSEQTGYGVINGTNAYGPVTESHIRSTDYPAGTTSRTTGPHGSQITTPALNFNAGVSDNGDRSILRDYYFTGTLPTTQRPFNAPTSTAEFQNRFRLCFNCHDWNTFYGNNNNTNFYNSGGMGPNNLHAYHLNGAGSGMGWNTTYEACMICHYNVHSNFQATNTDYGALVGSLPPDGDTHLVNFAPNVVTNLNYAKPAWYYSAGGGGQMNCNLRCHGINMDYSYDCTHTLIRSDGVSDTSDTCNDN